ncbi:MAG TPA: hypothetical protein VEP90_30675 [Methylomirabilota bacterium]|nr:hypothetical protein [Methylomirabilota bacterium]
MAHIKNTPSFWLINVSDRDVSLADLNLTIRAMSSVNLLDNRHYHYTVEQLTHSIASGSIFKKRNKIIVRKIAPEVVRANTPFLADATIPSRERSVLSIKEERYEELELSDAQFAEESANAEMEDQTQVKKR